MCSVLKEGGNKQSTQETVNKLYPHLCTDFSACLTPIVTVYVLVKICESLDIAKRLGIYSIDH